MLEIKTYMDRVRITITYIIVILMGLSCLLPLLNVVAISFSSSQAVAANKVGLIPIGWTTAPYDMLMEDSQFWRSFGISVLRVFLGLSINMLMSVLLAFPLANTKKDFGARDIVMGFVIFAMLFNGGLIPTYLTIKELNLINSIWVFVLPGAVPIFNVILLMNFFLAVPKSLEEAARIDGANPLQVLVKVYLPISVPALATIALFSAVGHWNDFFTGLIYITRVKNYPLQTYIQSMQIKLAELVQISDPQALINALAVNNRNLNAAKIVVSIVPLLLVYPLLQRYFITGIVVGSVKE